MPSFFCDLVELPMIRSVRCSSYLWFMNRLMHLHLEYMYSPQQSLLIHRKGCPRSESGEGPGPLPFTILAIIP